MRIYELLNEVISPELARTSLPLAARNLNSAMLLSRKFLDTDSPRMLIAGELNRWIQQNYLSSRTARNQGQNIHSTLEYLAREPKLRWIKDSLLKLTMDRENKGSTYDLIGDLLTTMARALAQIDPKDKSATNALATFDQLRSDIADIQAANKKPTKAEYAASVKAKQDAAQPKQVDVTGQQRAQAEQVVNAMLATLPKDVSAKARIAISKADNKLLALKQFLENIK